MIYLILAVLSSALISIIMRISTGKVQANLSMLATNYLICAFLGAWYTGFSIMVPVSSGGAITVGLGAVNGILYLAGFVLLQINTRKNGVVLSTLFMKLGLLVPIIMSIFLFKEMPTGLQIIGICIAIGAIVLINLKKDIKSGGFGIGLLIMLLAGGSADAMSKIYERIGITELSEQFLFYTFEMALVLCVLLVVVKKENPGLWDFFFGELIGIPNFFSAKFLLGSLRYLPAVVVYPTFSVATILLVTLVGVLIFKEQLSRRQWVAVAAIVLALFMLNI